MSSNAGVSAIAIAMPILAANIFFCTRRVNRGLDALDDNPFYSAANFGIAGGQALKGTKAACTMLKAEKTFESMAEGASLKIKELSEKNKMLTKAAKGTSKALNFVADNINPIIVGAGVLKVAGAEDKVDEAARESTRLLCMFGAEAGAKALIGMPFTKKVGQKMVMVERSGLLDDCFKNLFGEKQIGAIKDFVNSRAFLQYVPEKIANAIPTIFKALPSIIKGIAFVSASIIGYKVGDKVATAILGKKKVKEKND